MAVFDAIAGNFALLIAMNFSELWAVLTEETFSTARLCMYFRRFLFYFSALIPLLIRLTDSRLSFEVMYESTIVA